MKTLDMRGVAHQLIVIGIVSAVIIIGVGFTIGSKAASKKCPPVSGSVSSATSSAVSASVSGIKCASVAQISCSITNLPAVPVHAKRIQPKVTFTNTSASKASLIAYGVRYNLSADRTAKTEVGTQKMNIKLNPGQSITRNLRSYKTPYGVSGYEYMLHAVSYGSKNASSSCTAVAKLPLQ